MVSILSNLIKNEGRKIYIEYFINTEEGKFNTSEIGILKRVEANVLYLNNKTIQLLSSDSAIYKVYTLDIDGLPEELIYENKDLSPLKEEYDYRESFRQLYGDLDLERNTKVNYTTRRKSLTSEQLKLMKTKVLFSVLLEVLNDLQIDQKEKNRIISNFKNRVRNVIKLPNDIGSISLSMAGEPIRINIGDSNICLNNEITINQTKYGIEIRKISMSYDKKNFNIVSKYENETIEEIVSNILDPISKYLPSFAKYTMDSFIRYGQSPNTTRQVTLLDEPIEGTIAKKMVV